MTEPLDYDPLIEVTLPAPVAEVWDHLREPAKVRRWFGWEYEGLDDEIGFIFLGPPPEAAAELPPDAGLDVDDDGHTITWRYGAGQVDRLTLTPDGDGTRLRMSRTVPAETWDGVFDDLAEGWRIFIQQLRFALARHPGEERRTVWLQTAVRPGIEPIVELGLDGIGPSPSAWSGRLGPEVSAEGEVWFAGDGLVGVTVAGWGDGLAVVTTPRQDAAVILTLYGHDASAVAAVEAAWTAWWTAHIAAPDP